MAGDPHWNVGVLLCQHLENSYRKMGEGAGKKLHMRVSGELGCPVDSGMDREGDAGKLGW